MLAHFRSTGPGWQSRINAALRKAAMDRNLKLSEIAQRIVDAADLLGA